MPLETVRVTVMSDDVVPVPVDDVVVRFFESDEVTLVTEATTGAVETGVAEVTLDGDVAPVTYYLRFYIQQGSIVSPQQIAVHSPASGSPTGANNFEVEASVFSLPAATDVRLCRVSGFVLDPSGRPRAGANIQFVRCPGPISSGGALILGERVAQKTDRNGYMQIDLIRGSDYLVTVDGHENIPREVTVPDRSSMALAHLLFPVVATASFSPAGPWTVAVGGSLMITPTITASDYEELDGTALADVIYSIDDTSVASLETSSSSLIIHGVAAGTTTVRLERRDTSIVHHPDTGIIDDEIQVTVTP
jgi:hypothetical protein